MGARRSRCQPIAAVGQRRAHRRRKDRPGCRNRTQAPCSSFLRERHSN
jgi:hypothetical protein